MGDAFLYQGQLFNLKRQQGLHLFAFFNLKPLLKLTFHATEIYYKSLYVMCRDELFFHVKMELSETEMMKWIGPYGNQSV